MGTFSYAELRWDMYDDCMLWSSGLASGRV